MADKCYRCNGSGTIELKDGPPHYGRCPACNGSGERK